MLKVFKDLIAAYWIIGFIGSLSVWNMMSKTFLGLAVGILWIIACAYVLNCIANRRITKMVEEPNQNCDVELALNRLYGVYKDNIKSLTQLNTAVFISNYLMHYGKYSTVIKLLLKYDPERLCKRQAYLVVKYTYYYNLALCYLRLGKKDYAINYYMRADAVFNNPRFKQSQSRDFKIRHKNAYLVIIDDCKKPEQIGELLKEASKEGYTLSRVAACYSLVTTYLSQDGKQDEVQQYINFIKEHGGNTVYAKAAHQNDFSPEFLQKTNDEPWQPSPIKKRHFKTLLISAVLTAVILALSITVSALKPKEYFDYENVSANQPVLQGPKINRFVDKLYYAIFEGR